MLGELRHKVFECDDATCVSEVCLDCVCECVCGMLR